MVKPLAANFNRSLFICLLKECLFFFLAHFSALFYLPVNIAITVTHSSALLKQLFIYSALFWSYFYFYLGLFLM